MTAPDTLVELAERCEKATAEETGAILREAFEAIHGPKPDRILGGSPQLDAWLKLFNPFSALLRAGGFLDAAMTLVPEGMRENRYYLAIEQVWHEATGWEARFDTPADECGRGDTILAKAATPALALCAAALKALAQAKDSK